MTDQPQSHGPGHRLGFHDGGEDAQVTHHPRYQGTDEEAAVTAGRGPLAGRQRRVRVLVIAILVAVVLAMVLMHVTGARPKGTGSPWAAFGVLCGYAAALAAGFILIGRRDA